MHKGHSVIKVGSMVLFSLDFGKHSADVHRTPRDLHVLLNLLQGGAVALT